MRDMLTKSYAVTDRGTEKIIAIARKYGLKSVVEDVCTSRASYWKQKGRVAQSLQWLSRCDPDQKKLANAVRSLLRQGPTATDYTMLDTLLQGLGVEGGRTTMDTTGTGRGTGTGRERVVFSPIAFLSKYHEACVVIRNAEELNAGRCNREEHGNPLDARSRALVKENLHFLESEATKRLADLLCDVSFEEHPAFWLPILTQLEPFVYRRPPVVTASDSRRVLRRIEEISTSWKKDDFLPPVMPPWEQVLEAIVSIFHTWSLKNNNNHVFITGAGSSTFEIKGDQYVSLRDSIPILPAPTLLGHVDWVENIEKVITEEHLKSVYNKARKEALENKEKNEGESGLVPRMRWALAENLACSLGVAHREQRSTATAAAPVGVTAARRPLKHPRI